MSYISCSLNSRLEPVLVTGRLHSEHLSFSSIHVLLSPAHRLNDSFFFQLAAFNVSSSSKWIFPLPFLFDLGQSLLHKHTSCRILASFLQLSLKPFPNPGHWKASSLCVCGWRLMKAKSSQLQHIPFLDMILKIVIMMPHLEIVIFSCTMPYIQVKVTTVTHSLHLSRVQAVINRQTSSQTVYESVLKPAWISLYLFYFFTNFFQGKSQVNTNVYIIIPDIVLVFRFKIILRPSFYS